MCCGSFTDMRNIRRRQELHIRCPQSKSALLEGDMSSIHATQETGLVGLSDRDRLSRLGGFSGDGARLEDPPPNQRLKRLVDLLLLEEVESLREGPDT